MLKLEHPDRSNQLFTLTERVEHGVSLTGSERTFMRRALIRLLKCDSLPPELNALKERMVPVSQAFPGNPIGNDATSKKIKDQITKQKEFEQRLRH